MNYTTNPIMNPTSCLILQKLLETYRPEEFPALLHQCESWAKTQPLNSLHILDTAPVFTNTCAKYAALLAAGASLTICVSTSLTSGIPHDQALLPSLQLTLYSTRLNPLMTSSASTGSSDKKWTYSGSFNQIH